MPRSVCVSYLGGPVERRCLACAPESAVVWVCIDAELLQVRESVQRPVLKELQPQVLDKRVPILRRKLHGDGLVNG